MSNEKMRRDFEEWCCNADDGPLVDPVWIAYFDAETNEYGLNQIQRDWISWQASRAALCVELPKPISEHNTDINGFVNPLAGEYDGCLEDCREAIKSTGVRTR
jgi:hypothetical protein